MDREALTLTRIMQEALELEKEIKVIIDILKALSDVNRLRIINLLKDRTLCVCEIEYIMEVNQSNLSRHLKNMIQLGLLESERNNKYIYYSLNRAFLEKYPFINEIISLFGEEEVFAEDTRRLADYQKSDITCDCISQLNLERKLGIK